MYLKQSDSGVFHGEAGGDGVGNVVDLLLRKRHVEALQ
jgi:hypothetical protein